ncbi:MAG: hypothetical protein WA151_07380, partial [Desulfatirhabdiaceae bacterium]
HHKPPSYEFYDDLSMTLLFCPAKYYTLSGHKMRFSLAPSPSGRGLGCVLENRKLRPTKV